MKRRATGIFLAVLLILTLFVGSVQAQSVSPMTSNNLYSHDYLLYRSYNRPWNWADTILSYLIAHEDGSYTRVEATSDYDTDEATRCVTVETYSSAFSITSQKQIAFELPLFGGFYEGSDYYFLVFGQNNPNETDDREVVRVVRYTKSWQRLDAVSIYGANTYIPFDAGCLRMVEADGMLYIHTCHEMYQTSDGLHHQANMTFTIRISDMTLTDSNHRIWNIAGGYVSHSFNQFIARDGADLVTVDHGDANPRSVVLCRYSGGAGSQTLADYVSYVNVLNIHSSDSKGYNYTGTQVGALQVSDTHYLVAGTSVAQDDTYDSTGAQNVFLTATPKDNLTEAATTLTYFTHEPLNSAVEISNPYLVRIAGTKYLLMWNADDILNYQFVDGAGQPISEVKTMNAQLSDCVPVVAGDQVVWYVTNNSAPMFFAIDLSGQAHTHSYTDVVTAPDCMNRGYTTHVCSCGDRFVDTYVAATGHNWGEFYQAIAPGCTTYGETRANCQNPGCRYYAYRDIAPLGHSYEGGTCTRCGEADPNAAALFDIPGVSMSLGNSLAMYYYVPAANITDGCYAEITRAGKMVQVPFAGCAKQAISGVEYYIVPFDGIAAKEMTDELTCVAYNKDGTAISNPKTTSVETYALKQLETTTNAKLRTVLVDMLNYGAAAQEQFQYNTDVLANARLTDTQKNYATGSIDISALNATAVKGNGWKGSSLTLESNIQLAVFFNSAVVTKDMTAKISYTDHYGKAVSYDIPGSAFGSYDASTLYVSVETLAAADLETVVSIDIMSGDTLVSHNECNMALYCTLASTDPMVIALAKLMDIFQTLPSLVGYPTLYRGYWQHEPPPPADFP